MNTHTQLTESGNKGGGDVDIQTLKRVLSTTLLPTDKRKRTVLKGWTWLTCCQRALLRTVRRMDEPHVNIQLTSEHSLGPRDKTHSPLKIGLCNRLMGGNAFSGRSVFGQRDKINVDNKVRSCSFMELIHKVFYAHLLTAFNIRVENAWNKKFVTQWWWPWWDGFLKSYLSVHRLGH